MKKIIVVLTIMLTAFSQINDQSYYDFLMLEKIRRNSEYENFYVAELNKYITMFPESNNAAKALLIIGDIRYADKDYHKAMVYYLKVHVLFSSQINEDTKTRMNDIMTSKEKSDYENRLPQFQDVMQKSYEGNLMDNLYQYVKILFESGIENYYSNILKEARTYLNLFPNSINNDNMLLIIAKTLELQGEEQKAMFYYEMMVSTFPNSPQLSFAKYQIASLMLTEFKEYTKAIDVFKDVIANDPDYQFAHEAQFQIGKIYQDKLDQSEPAINNYNKYIMNYADGVHAVQSLFNIAEIQDDEDLYESEIGTFKRVTSQYVNHPKAPEAQQKIIDLYDRRLNDLKRAAEEYISYSTLFPDHKDTPEMIYEGIEIYLEELKLLPEAQEAFKILETKYADSKYTSNSAELIKDYIKENPQSNEE